MALYETLNDEDYNEDYNEDYVEDYNEDYNEDSNEDYTEGGGEDYSEDYNESGDYSEARKKRRRNRRSGVRGSVARGRDGRRGRSRNLQHSLRPVSERSVQKAFNNVGDDVNTLKRKIRLSGDSMSTQLGIETLVAALFPPTIIMIKNPDATSEIKEIPVIEDTLIPRTLVTILAAKVTGGRDVNLKKVLPWILGAFLVSPSSFNQLGLGTSANTGTASTGSGHNTPLNGLFGNTSTTTLLLVAGLVYFTSTQK